MSHVQVRCVPENEQLKDRRYDEGHPDPIIPQYLDEFFDKKVPNASEHILPENDFEIPSPPSFPKRESRDELL
jgi:hypothetical protein